MLDSAPADARCLLVRLGSEEKDLEGFLRAVLAPRPGRRGRLTAIALPASREHIRLRTPELGTDAALIGAAELAFENLLSDPLLG